MGRPIAREHPHKEAFPIPVEPVVFVRTSACSYAEAGSPEPLPSRSEMRLTIMHSALALRGGV
jgi:hypothetical protein